MNVRGLHVAFTPVPTHPPLLNSLNRSRLFSLTGSSQATRISRIYLHRFCHSAIYPSRCSPTITLVQLSFRVPHSGPAFSLQCVIEQKKKKKTTNFNSSWHSRTSPCTHICTTLIHPKAPYLCSRNNSINRSVLHCFQSTILIKQPYLLFCRAYSHSLRTHQSFSARSDSFALHISFSFPPLHITIYSQNSLYPQQLPLPRGFIPIQSHNPTHSPFPCFNNSFFPSPYPKTSS